MKTIKLAVRKDGTNPSHHLWDNNGTWWCQFTVHHGPFSKRTRISLETRDVEEACRRRDHLFKTFTSSLSGDLFDHE